MSSSPSMRISPPQEGEAKTNEELYQQFTNLVSSWPCSPALSNYQLYRHDNGWHSSLAPMVGTMVADACFAARPSDIIVATLPKSGTTWIKALLYSTVHRREHPADSCGHPFNIHGPHECIKFLEYQLYTQNRIPDLDELPDPRLFATHVPFVSLPRSVVASGCKIVYVCRDPKDTLISHWNFANKFRVRDGLEPLSVETAADYFCDGVSPFGPYWDHVLGYWRAHSANPEQVLFFRLAKFVGCPFSVEEEEVCAVDAIVKLCSFEHMTGLEATKGGKTELTFGVVENSSFFRRGQVGDWENHLSPETARKIDAISEAKFRGSATAPLNLTVSPLGAALSDGTSSSTVLPPSIHAVNIGVHIDFKLDPISGNYSKWRCIMSFVFRKSSMESHVLVHSEPLQQTSQWRQDDFQILLMIYVQGDLRIGEYCRRLKALADELDKLDEHVSDKTLTLQLTCGLSPWFQVMVLLLPMQVSFPNFV
ncbi:Sulfotransferase 17 [Triticum urartu]|uniref:Sulfotransferase n=1 Tax=Triticum urartu TaxID=4572 RepID=M8A3J8_TRIUA|nr:Sulfotransferase 17 [Triticum urartu]